MLQSIFAQGVEIIEEYITKSNEGVPMVVDVYIPSVKLAIEYLILCVDVRRGRERN
jgi:hypothetical protein